MLERCRFPVTEAERVKPKLQRQWANVDMQPARGTMSHVVYSSPKWILKWNYSPKGFCLAIVSHAAVREHQASAWGRNPNLSILRIFRSFRFGRTLTKGVRATAQSRLPNIFSLHRSGTFLNFKDWSTTATAHCFTSYPACWLLEFPSSQRRSREFPNVFHRSVGKEGMSWNSNLHNACAVFK